MNPGESLHRYHAPDGWRAKCPCCDRVEDMDNPILARAWLYRHIGTKHAEELPNP